MYCISFGYNLTHIIIIVKTCIEHLQSNLFDMKQLFKKKIKKNDNIAIKIYLTSNRYVECGCMGTRI